MICTNAITTDDIGGYLSGVYDTARLQYQIEAMKERNVVLAERNQALKAEVLDLRRQGHEAIEERSRNDLGLVKPGETFIQIIDKRRR